MKKREIRFGIIGLGLMGREFASAIARWFHLTEDLPQPVLTGICDKNRDSWGWFTENISSIETATDDYKELLASNRVDAVYCAVPHNLHERFYVDIIRSGKHLMGEKPFGIDKKANEAIMEAVTSCPDCFVRCSSEFPFTPAIQMLCGMIEAGSIGRIIEVEAGFLHSSDMNPDKSINWKRMIEYNGEYGVLGDLGMHPCHVPFRAGWIPMNVRAVLSNIVKERPDGAGGRAACETWDNAILLCETVNKATGDEFPMTIKTQRIAPGQKNTWYLSVMGVKASARFSTKNINSLQLLEYHGGEQAWQNIDMGHETAFKSITGGIFEFGFSDAIIQMWAGYLYELEHGKPKNRFAGCVTPEETALSHKLFTAALESNKSKSVVILEDI